MGVNRRKLSFRALPDVVTISPKRQLGLHRLEFLARCQCRPPSHLRHPHSLFTLHSTVSLAHSALPQEPNFMNSPLRSPLADAAYDTVKSPRSSGYVSPPYSRSSHESDEDSLRALELSDGPLLVEPSRRGRSYSVSGFDFQRDLLPLSASLSEPDNLREGKDKHIGLINGKPATFSYPSSASEVRLLEGIALVVGLQVCTPVKPGSQCFTLQCCR